MPRPIALLLLLLALAAMAPLFAALARQGPARSASYAAAAANRALALSPSASPSRSPSRSPTRSPSRSPTRSPTPLPTSPPEALAPSPPISTIQIRVDSQQACYAQGEGINCQWNAQFLQDIGYAYSCQPSTLYAFPPTTAPGSMLGYVSSCEKQPVSLCTFQPSLTGNSFCVFSNSSICEPDPLEILVRSTIDLVNYAPQLRSVLQLPSVCTQVLVNTSCTQPCVWMPSASNPSVLKDAEALKPGTPAPTFAIKSNSSREVQLLTLQTPNITTSSPDVYLASVTPPTYDATIVTITTLVDPSINIAGGGFYILRPGGGNQSSTSLIPWNASATTLQNLLVKGLGLSNASTSVFADPPMPSGSRSWVVRCANTSQAALFNSTVSKLTQANGVVAPWTHGGPQVVLTRHHRNTQIVSLVGPSPIVSGSFRLQYTWPGCSNLSAGALCGPLNSQSWPRGQQVTTPLAIPFNASASDVQAAMINLDVDGVGPAVVSVQLINSTSDLRDLSSVLNVTVQRAWRIVFATTVESFELSELPLVPSTQCPGGTPCPPLLTANGSLASLRVDVRYAAPVVAGSIGAFQTCFLDVQVPGLFKVRTNDSIVNATLDATSGPGDWIRLSGNYYNIVNVTTLNQTKQMVLNRPFTQSLPQGDQGLDVLLGIRAYDCSVQTTTAVDAHPPSSGSSSIAGALTAAAAQHSLSLGLQGVQVQVNESQLIPQLATLQWNISVITADGSLPFLSLYVFPGAGPLSLLWPQSTLWGQTGASVSIAHIAQGSAPASGLFQIAFAGYHASDFNYTVLTTLFAGFSFLPTGGILSNQLPYTQILSVSPSPSAAALESALNGLPNIGSVSVAMMPNGVYNITFYPDASDLPLNGDVPQLYVVTEIGLLGSGVGVYFSTRINGTGTGSPPPTPSNVTQYVEVAVNPFASPCMAVNVPQRLASNSPTSTAQQIVSRFASLDSQFLQCAQAATREQCVGPTASPTAVNCAWRGPSLFQLLSNMSSIDANFVYVQAQNITLTNPYALYGGNTSQSIWSNCSVEYSSLISQLLGIIALYNNASVQTAMQPVVALSTAFERCGLNPAVKVQAYGAAQFVDAWQQMVTTTCYTCMFCYGIAGILLAGRMDKFKMWGFSFSDTLSGLTIILSSIIFGGVYAFLIAAIPAALITQMYASIPVRVEQAWATSLGVAQGIMIIYFDLGRSATPVDKL